MTQCIGERIKEMRTLLGLSQEELGRRVGVQRAAINKYENGAVSNIPIKTIEKLADIFEVSPTYLVGWQIDVLSDLSLEVKIIQGVNVLFGREALSVLEAYSNLNAQGRKRVDQYISDIELLYSNSPSGN